MTNFGIFWHKKPASHLSSKQIMTEQKPTASAIGAVCFHASRGCGFPDFFYSVCLLVSPWLLLSMCATNWGNSGTVCFFFFFLLLYWWLGSVAAQAPRTGVDTGGFLRVVWAGISSPAASHTSLTSLPCWCHNRGGWRRADPRLT